MREPFGSQDDIDEVLRIRRLVANLALLFPDQPKAFGEILDALTNLIMDPVE